ncbi:MAG: aminopeptidase P family protein [Clostridium sp.]|jgi:Xaa-Pro aminopeptidase|nr:aminopeptidase P family protein [Clostridium sp.]
MNNNERILSALPKNTAAWISSPPACRYLSGFAADNCLCLLSRGGYFYLTDKRYLEAARRCVTELEPWDIADIDKLIEKLPESEFAIEGEHTTLAQLARRQEKHPELSFSAQEGLDGLIDDLRSVKTPPELERIRRAQSIAERALESLLPHIREGVSEREIALELDYTMLRLGADALSFETIVVSGENSSLPHGVPGERRLRRGDILTIDFGAVVEGYHSDMTRSFAIGTIAKEECLVYELVLAAQEAGIAAARPGISCRELDGVVRAVFEQAGMGEYFCHGTGHGVGLEIHEAPNVGSKSDTLLREGMVITIEPGLYLPERFGVRIEDMVQISAEGCVNLTSFDKSLRIL